jgi:hypothetical protein
MTTSPSPADPSPPAPPARPPATGWQRFKAETIRLFHQYANWLVSISWKRFFVYSVVLLIGALILQHLPPFNYTDRQRRRRLAHHRHRRPPPTPPTPPSPSGLPSPPSPPSPPGGREPSVKIEKKDSKGGDVVISIDRDGVRISPHVQIDRNGVRIGPGAITGGASGAASGPRRGERVGVGCLGERRRERRHRDQVAARRRQRAGARGGRGSARRGHRGDPRIAGEAARPSRKPPKSARRRPKSAPRPTRRSCAPSGGCATASSAISSPTSRG